MTVVESAERPLPDDPGGSMGGEGSQRFRFVDAFAGIGGMRAGLEMAGGRCVYTIERDPYACRTYSANWDAIEPINVRDVAPTDPGRHEIFAAGFPCQPFSLAGVVKKEALRRRSLAANGHVDEELVKLSHGFHDPVSGNLFFEIVRLIGGPWDLPQKELEREASEADWYDLALAREGERLLARGPGESMPPVLLLENVRNLESHDGGRTFRIIRRRLLRSGYRVEHRVVSAKHWVPQDRRRIFIVAFRRDLFDRPFEFPPVPQASEGLTDEFLEDRRDVLESYRLTPGVWAALERHRKWHESKGHGFGYSIAELGRPTRTLSARYYKDGAEILIRLPEDMQAEGKAPCRRLTPRECARLMGFVRPHLERDFVIPVSDNQAYKQFGNAVVVPQVRWLADEIAAQAAHVFSARRLATTSAELAAVG
jgi:DNA (cytosine-5)-methyltransferase 1